MVNTFVTIDFWRYISTNLDSRRRRVLPRCSSELGQGLERDLLSIDLREVRRRREERRERETGGERRVVVNCGRSE